MSKKSTKKAPTAAADKPVPILEQLANWNNEWSGPIGQASRAVQELEGELAHAKRVLDFRRKQRQQLGEATTAAEVEQVLSRQLWEIELAEILGANKVTTFHDEWNSKLGKRVNKPTGAVNWNELRTKGATDAQIGVNLANLGSRWDTDLWFGCWKLGTKSQTLSRYAQSRSGGLALESVTRAELIAGVRRILGIPLPKASGPAGKAPAAAKPKPKVKPAKKPAPAPKPAATIQVRRVKPQADEPAIEVRRILLGDEELCSKKFDLATATVEQLEAGIERLTAIIDSGSPLRPKAIQKRGQARKALEKRKNPGATPAQLARERMVEAAKDSAPEAEGEDPDAAIMDPAPAAAAERDADEVPEKPASQKVSWYQWKQLVALEIHPRGVWRQAYLAGSKATDAKVKYLNWLKAIAGYGILVTPQDALALELYAQGDLAEEAAEAIQEHRKLNPPTGQQDDLIVENVLLSLENRPTFGRKRDTLDSQFGAEVISELVQRHLLVVRAKENALDISGMGEAWLKARRQRMSA